MAAKKTKTKKPPPATATRDPFRWLENPDAWTWIDETPCIAAAIADLLADAIAGIESGESERVAEVLRIGLWRCFPHTDEYKLALQLWEVNLFEDLPIQIEPRFLLARALERAAKGGVHL
jgi:hypothetical protein